METSNQEREIYNTVKSILIAMGHSEKAVVPSAAFIKDLGFDSLDYAEFIMEMENAFRISIPFEAVEENCNTVDDLTRIVSQMVSASAIKNSSQQVK